MNLHLPSMKLPTALGRMIFTRARPVFMSYNVNAVQRQRRNGQLTLQFAPVDNLTATVDYTYVDHRVQRYRDELQLAMNCSLPSVLRLEPAVGPTAPSPRPLSIPNISRQAQRAVAIQPGQCDDPQRA